MLPPKRFKQTVLNFGRVYTVNEYESDEATASYTSDPIPTTTVTVLSDVVSSESDRVTSESDVVSEPQTTLSPPVDICTWTTETTRTVCKPILQHYPCK